MLQPLTRAIDPVFINALVRRPDVRAQIGAHDCELDFAPVIANPRHLILQNQDGASIAIWREPGLYEVNLLPSLTGERGDALAIALEAVRYVFANTDAVDVATSFPALNDGALWLARSAGFEEICRRLLAWPLADGTRTDTVHLTLSALRWTMTDPTLPEIGRTFRSEVEKLAGQPRRPDVTFDRFMGAFALLVRAGNIEKAAWLYQRNGVFICGYPEILLLGANPVVVDIAGAEFVIRDDGLDLLSGGMLAKDGGHA